jgi:hypothetical protein
MAEDLSVFFALGDGMAESVVVGGVLVNAIFDQATELVLGEVLGTYPTLLLPAASVPAAVDGTACTVRATAYTVRQVLAEAPDGALVRLVLRQG